MTDKQWEDYKNGTRAIDQLYSDGRRCPSNLEGLRCKCAQPAEKICKYWHALVELVKQMDEPILTRILDRMT